MMMMMERMQILTLLAITADLFIVRNVDTFDVAPGFDRSGRRMIAIGDVNAPQLHSLLTHRLYSTVSVPVVAPTKEEKLTKEASELLEAFDAKQRGDKALVLAQVAPSVRYVPERASAFGRFQCEQRLLTSHNHTQTELPFRKNSVVNQENSNLVNSLLR
jgi:hypothetical protein